MTDPASRPPFEFLQHTADLCMLARGGDLRGLFRNAMKGMFCAMKPNVTTEETSRHMRVAGTDREDLLVNFLNELIFNAETYQEAYENADFEAIGDRELSVRLFGRKTDGFNMHVKAATHHDLAVRRTEDGYEGQVVFDI